jgi:hypothetical protein
MKVYLTSDHVPMMISKYAISQVVGFIKSKKKKGTIHWACVCGEEKRTFVGQHF